MSARAVTADVVLVLGVLAELVCVLGTVWMRDVLDRLHFAAAGTTVAPVLVAIAVVLAGMSTTSALVQSLAALLALLLLNPVLTHATARAVHRLRRTGDPGASTPEG